MRKTSLRRIFDDFEDSVDFYSAFAQKIVSAQRVIRYKYEKTELLEAFVLRIVALWEVFIEDVLAACLNRDSAKYASYRGLKLRKHLSADEAYAMLTGLGYLDFRSVGELRKRAADILVVDPFASIPKSARLKIDELGIIRNYLAHYSGRAKRRLAAMYENVYRMRRFREPGEFLWADSRPGGPIRLGVYLGALRDASSNMRKALGNLAA